MHLLIASSFDPQPNSGAAGSLIAIGQAHRRRGHHVDWLWIPPHAASRAWNELFNLPAQQAYKIGAYLREHPQTDVVLVSQPYAYRAFEKLRPRHPHVVFINRTHGWEPRGTESEELFGWGRPVGTARRVVRGLSRRNRAKMCRRVVLAADGLIAACRHDVEWIRRSYPVAAERVACIPYGLQTDSLPPPTTRSGLPQRLVFAGQFLARKGSRLLKRILPQTAAAFPEARLTFVVLPEQVDAVRRAFAPSWGERLTVHPWMPQGKLFEIFGAHDLLLFPSYFEGFGKVVVEAMAMGCVPLGFDEAAMSDVTDGGVLTCKHGDEAAFAACLHDCMSGRIALGETTRRGTEQARGRSWDAVAADEEAFFRELAALRGR